MPEIPHYQRAKLEPWLVRAAQGIEIVDHGGLLGWHVVVHNAKGGHEAAGTVVAGCPSELEAEMVGAALWRMFDRARALDIPVQPSGWYVFGTHAGWDSDDIPDLEFHPDLDEAGMPRWERPRAR